MNTVVTKPEGSVFWGAFWMLILSLLLFWLPGVGSLIAGIVGGKVAGGVGNGLLAAILPSLILGLLLFLCATLLTGLPLIGVVFAVGGTVLALGQVGVLLVGAIIGGLMA
jgi:hypothetical protein